MSKNIKQMKDEKAITLVALIITVIIMLILATMVVNYSIEAINKAKLEDIKINMLLLQGKSKTIKEKFEFKEIETLVGLKVEIENLSNISYQIQVELLNILTNNTEGNYYIWEQQDLEANGLNSIKITQEDFYIVDYTTGEIYYSLGYKHKENGETTTYYTLTELQNI